MNKIKNNNEECICVQLKNCEKLVLCLLLTPFLVVQRRKSSSFLQKISSVGYWSLRLEREEKNEEQNDRYGGGK
jgi:hypothetical protein